METAPALFDSHAHFAAEDAAAVVARARAAGLAGVAAIGADARANEGALAAARSAPDFVRLSLGFDYSSGMAPEAAVAELAALRDAAPVSLSAIGEIGLDAHYGDPADAPAQRALFGRQVALAAEWGLPVVVHCREAEADVLDILRRNGSAALAAEGRLGVLHCFVGDAEFARAVLDLGMMVSLSGIVTFRNADALRAVARMIPSDRLLVETDSPYLAPVPLRGKVNEPAFVVHTARLLAQVRGVPERDLAESVRANALRLFKAGER